MKEQNRGQEPTDLYDCKEFLALKTKEQKFVLAYLRHFGIQKAAIEAGYSEKSAHTLANRLLKKPDIQKVLNIAKQKASQDLIKHHNITKDSIRDELAKIAFATAEDFGNWAIGSRGCLQIKMADKINSLQLLGKVVGLFDDDSGTNEKPVDTGIQTRLHQLRIKYTGKR